MRPYEIANEYAGRKDSYSEMRRQIAETIGSGESFSWNDKWILTKQIETLIDLKIAEAMTVMADRIEAATNVRL